MYRQTTFGNKEKVILWENETQSLSIYEQPADFVYELLIKENGTVYAGRTISKLYEFYKELHNVL